MGYLVRPYRNRSRPVRGLLWSLEGRIIKATYPINGSAKVGLHPSSSGLAHEEDTNVRVVVRDGEPWFVLADVCRVLEIKNPSDVAAKLDEDEKATLANSEGRANGARFFTIVNESGLYSVIFMSRKDSARRFKKWVTSEVLPLIRVARCALARRAATSRRLPRK